MSSRRNKMGVVITCILRTFLALFDVYMTYIPTKKTSRPINQYSFSSLYGAWIASSRGRMYSFTSVCHIDLANMRMRT